MKYLSRSNKIPIALFLSLTAGLLLAGCNQKKTGETEQEKSVGRTLEYTRNVTFMNSEGDSVSTIKTAVADEESERNMGLMDVSDLPPNKGMLFIFEDNAPRSFWMANTPLSLDIIFVNSQNKIVRIHNNTQPFSDKSLASDEPAKYVIETNAGFCISHDIQEGMIVEFENGNTE